MVKKKRPRRPGEGSVYKRKDGRWVCEITLEDHSRKQYYFKTEREALEKCRLVLNELAQGTLAIGPQQTLKHFLEYWLENVYRPSVRVTTYRNACILVNKHLVPGLGHVKLQKLTTQQIQLFYTKLLKKGVKGSRIRNINATLHTALEHARRTRLVSINVCSDVQLPKQKEPERRPLTFEQAILLMQKIKGHWLEGLITTALATGMREGELLGLRWSDIDLREGVLRIARTVVYVTGHGFVEGEPKTPKSRRSILLPQFVIDALKQHCLRQSDQRLAVGDAWVDRDLVFPDKDGDFIMVTTLLQRFYKLLKEAGLPRVRFHDLRHSAATLLLGMGVDMKIVQELLGHASIRMTADIYGHVLPPTHKSAMDKMGRFLDSGSG